MSNNKLYSDNQVSYHKLQQKKSGQSIASYCRQHGIKPSTFYSWNKRTALAGPSSQSTSHATFVEVPIKQMAKRSCSRIRITRTEFDVPVESLQQVSDALQGIFIPGNHSQC